MRATNESVVLARHINAFLNEYVPSQKTKSAHTLKAYSDALSLYIGFLETEKGINSSNLNGNCFCAANIEDWLVWLMEGRSCSPETCNNRLASLRAFLKYLGNRDLLYLHLSQAASQIERRKVYTKKVTGMSKKAVSALLEAPDTSTKAGRRDIALMVVMYSTAARIDEILSMRIEQLHLDTDKPNITVIGKRDKIRTLYLLPKATAHLRAYIKDSHGATPNPSSFVFYSRNTGPAGKMSQKAVNKQLRKHAQAARSVCGEVPAKIHAHQLRHYGERYKMVSDDSKPAKPARSSSIHSPFYHCRPSEIRKSIRFLSSDQSGSSLVGRMSTYAASSAFLRVSVSALASDLVVRNS